MATNVLTASKADKASHRLALEGWQQATAFGFELKPLATAGAGPSHAAEAGMFKRHSASSDSYAKAQKAATQSVADTPAADQTPSTTHTPK